MTRAELMQAYDLRLYKDHYSGESETIGVDDEYILWVCLWDKGSDGITFFVELNYVNENDCMEPCGRYNLEIPVSVTYEEFVGEIEGYLTESGF